MMLSRKLKWFLLFQNEAEFHELFLRDCVVYKNIHGEFLFVRDNETYHAFKNKCPHQNKPLNDCQLVDGAIVCAWHKYQFSVNDGRGHGLNIEKYPLKFENGGVFIGKEIWAFF